MKASKYLKERERMCNSYKYCSDCGFGKHGISCSNLEASYPKKAVKIIKKWSKNNVNKEGEK